MRIQLQARMSVTALTGLALAAGGCDSSMSSGPPDAGAADLAATTDAGAPDLSPADAGPPLRAIATKLQTTSKGSTFVTVQVSIGGGAPFTAFVDTGSVGLRVLGGVVDPADWTVTKTATPTYGYGSGTQLDGVVANAVVTIDGVRSAGPIAVESVTAVGCEMSKPNCPAAGKTPDTYRFAETFPAIMGVGMRASPASTKVGSPLALLATTGRFILSLGPTDDGRIVLDPPDTARFTNVISLPNKGPSVLPMYSSWDDTKVPFCANSFCGMAVMDTGNPNPYFDTMNDADLMALGVPKGSTRVPNGTALAFTINAKTAFRVTAGTPAISVGNTNPYSNIGQLPFRALDVLYDHAHGTIAVAPAP